MCPPKKPKKISPVAPPPPADDAAVANQSGPVAPEEASGDALLQLRRKGRSGLRIPLTGSAPTASGLNVPK